MPFGFFRLSTLTPLALSLMVPSPSLAATPLPDGQERQLYDTLIPFESTHMVLVEGRLPYGLKLEGDGRLHGYPSYPGHFTMGLRGEQDGEAVFDFFDVEIAPWQGDVPVACGDTVAIELEKSARHSTRTFDVDLPGAAAFYSLPLDDTLAAVTLKLAGNTGADGALMLSRSTSGAASGEIYTYYWIEDHPGDEHLRLTDASPEYSLASYRGVGRVPITVVADTPGVYSLTVSCAYGVAGVGDYLPNATQGIAYAAQVSAEHGEAPYTFYVSQLPQGLSLDPATGWITGTPEGSGVFELDATVTEQGGAQDSWTLSLWVVSPTILFCGDVWTGRHSQSAFPGEQGLATPGAVGFFDVEWDQNQSKVTLVLEGGDGQDYTPALFVGEPDSTTGANHFSAYNTRQYDRGNGAQVVIDFDRAPFLSAYDRGLSIALASVEGDGEYTLSVHCSDELTVSPKMPHPPLSEAFTAQFDVFGSGNSDVQWSIATGMIPEGLVLDSETGTISGVAVGEAQEFTVVATNSGGTEARRAFMMTPGDGFCGSAIPLECGDFEVGTLLEYGWENRVTLALDNPEGTDFYCLRPDADTSVVELILSPISGSNADLLLGATGVNPGSVTVSDYVRYSTLDGEDYLEIYRGDYPTWDAGLPLALAVTAFEVGSYTLEMMCE